MTTEKKSTWLQYCLTNGFIPAAMIGITLLTLEIIYFDIVLGWVIEAFVEGLPSGIFVVSIIIIITVGLNIFGIAGMTKAWKEYRDGK